MKSSLQKLRVLGAEPVNAQARAFLSRRKPKSKSTLRKKPMGKRPAKSSSNGKDINADKSPTPSVQSADTPRQPLSEPKPKPPRKKTRLKSKHRRKPQLDIFERQALARKRGRI